MMLPSIVVLATVCEMLTVYLPVPPAPVWLALIFVPAAMPVPEIVSPE